MQTTWSVNEKNAKLFLHGNGGCSISHRDHAPASTPVLPRQENSLRLLRLLAATPHLTVSCRPDRFPQKWQTNGNNSQARFWVPH
jgi:hypothetical protein